MSKSINEFNKMKMYGLTDNFLDLANEYKGLTVARVILQEKGLYRIVSEMGEKLGEISGKFRYVAKTISDYPAVGDFVMTDWNEEGSNALIHSVLSRKSCFMRKAAGNGKHEQIVASNIDIVFCCMALNNDFNLRRLERYLSIAWNSGAVPVIVLTKADLCRNPESRIVSVSAVTMGADIVTVTATRKSGYEQIKSYINEGKTIAFIGSSGVGKSSLINCLLGENRLETNGVRNDDRGRHTTTHRELILLPDGGMVIDTPGMRELGMWDSDDGIEHAFADIEELSQMCHFRNCTHTNEPSCAILKALNAGELSIERWHSYQKLKAENAYAEDSESYLVAKERKFKEIAKINKTNNRKY